ncbi:MbnP family copper-binding protein [Conexibacter arvalis]|uniref:Putative repeat protein (TIGR04052 family) n=1 Tax=Conexibacter arvalis TaxID=912552 RepID=A0A840IGG9_9ACTN|nr:MbnP family copper-binding protein [Conexibacter arvalis]MBB4663435.1 putative repeat protein (TIGR04052 family) [Conexibacter arvalis]
MGTTVRTATAALCAALGVAVIAAPADAAGRQKQQPRRQAVAIDFAAVAGSSPVSCGKPIAGLGTTAATARLTDLRFFVSDVRLLRRDGRAVALKLRADSPYRVTRGKAAVTLIDLENGRGGCAGGTRGTNASVRGTVRRGDYVGVRWTVGVPFALNHTDATTAPAPLNSAAMAWSWQVGRKFTKIEVSDPGDGAAPWAARTFFVHLGSTGCAGNPATGATVRCAAANRAGVTLRRFDPKRQRIAVDLKALLAGVDVTRNGGGAPGCMANPSDPECGPVFRAFGLRLPAAAGDGAGGHGDHAGGGDPGADGDGGHAMAAAGGQTVFRAIKR